VENECTSRNFSTFTIFVPKIIKIDGNLTEVLTKTILHSFLDTVYIMPENAHNASSLHQLINDFKNSNPCDFKISELQQNNQY